MFAIIGGSGFEKFDAFETVETIDRETPFGLASSGIKKVKIDGKEALFVSRHGENHELLPSEVNYRANVLALKRSGASAIVSFSAIGSLQKELKPGDMVVPNQYIDRTKGVRKHTFCGDGIVGHVSLAKPICNHMKAKAEKLAEGKSWDSHLDKTYVCIEGPHFSTKSESHTYRDMGADVIGMTHFPEYALVREAGIPYLPCCFVTDYDCWDDSIPHVTLQEVIEVMRNNNAKAFEFTQDLMALGDDLWAESMCHNKGLRTGLMTPKEAISKEQMTWLEALL